MTSFPRKQALPSWQGLDGIARTLAAQQATAEESEDEGAAEARESFLAYQQRAYPKFQAPAHIAKIAEKLHQVERGEIDRLIISLPPRHGKTFSASVGFPAWFLGRNPDQRVIGVSYASALADRISRQARARIGGRGWPFRLTLSESLAQVKAWDIEGRDGGYIAAGVGGPITGQGGNLILIDDPIKNDLQAMSAEYRENLWEWYQSVLYTRLEDGGRIILINTRWHHDDLAGRLLNAQREGGDHWEVLNLPAYATPDDALGRPEGAALWPEKYDETALARIRLAVGSRVWEALYQGNPSDEETALFKRADWRYYDAAPQDMDSYLQSWDMAFKDTKGSDFVVGQVWGQRRAHRYLLDQVRGRMSFTATVEAVRAMSARWPQAFIKLVEDKANGPAVIDTLYNDLPGFIAVNPEGGKYARASAVSPQVEAHNVWLPSPETHPWVRDYVQEHATFPTAAHDDQVDATSQALLRMAQSRLPFSWLDDEEEAAGRGETGPAPPAPAADWWDEATDILPTDGPHKCPSCGRGFGGYEAVLIHLRGYCRGGASRAESENADALAVSDGVVQG
jgi:predicted phage terminase large subunit-like protein